MNPAQSDCDKKWSPRVSIFIDIDIDIQYLLTAIGLTTGGRSTVHIYTQTAQRTIQDRKSVV